MYRRKVLSNFIFDNQLLFFYLILTVFTLFNTTAIQSIVSGCILCSFYYLDFCFSFFFILRIRCVFGIGINLQKAL